MTQSSRTPRRSFVPLLALVSAAVLVGCGGDDDNAPVPGAANTVAPADAYTTKGVVRAVRDNTKGMASYFAIPYAKPPLANLRWTAPQEPDAWSTVRTNTKAAAPCLQTSASPYRLTGDSEDCLYVDVHAPLEGKGPFPVIVWIHGGAFNTGGTVTYSDPSPLVNKGAVVVNIAYRLGALGFLGHSALVDSSGAAGNYGIMDQQAALRGVRDNIQVFAGDKNNVTIMGESAGGASVLTHMASPASAGLFHKAIVQSGAYVANAQLSMATLKSRSDTVVANAMAAAGVTCTTVDAACLRNLPESVIRTQLATAFNASMSSPVPSIDGKVLTKSVKQHFIDGTNQKVPLLNGSNEDEYSLFLAISELGRRAAATPPNFDPTDTSFAISASTYGATVGGLTGLTGSALNSALAAYPLADYGTNVALQPTLVAVAAATDASFACNGVRLSERSNSQGTATWAYEFRDQTAPPTAGLVNGTSVVSFPQGAGHSYEMSYLFNLQDLGAASSERNALKTTMTQYWTNFARNGNPNVGATVPTWSSVGTGGLQALDVTSDGGVRALSTTSFKTQHKCDAVWGHLTF